MEEILRKFDSVLQTVDDYNAEFEADFEKFKQQLDATVAGRNEINLTPQQKKKMKRLSVIIDNEESAKNISNDALASIDEVVIKTEIQEVTNTSLRPARAAKSKIESFKLPTLNGKLRRPSAVDSTLSVSRSLALNNTKNETINNTKTSEGKSTNSTKRSFEEDNENNNKDDTVEEAKKVDESIVVVSNGEVPVLELSSGSEAGNLMPPPVELPKKKTTRKAQQEPQPIPIPRSSRLRIKQEKLSIATNTDSLSSISDVSTEKTADLGVKEEKGKARTKKSKKQFKCLPIVEPKSEPDEQLLSTETNEKSNKEKSKPSMESVYEDAESGDMNKAPEDKKSDATENNAAVIQETATETRNEAIAADATFVSAKDVPCQESDATFVAPQTTFTMESNKTHIVAKTIPNAIDATFSVNNETFKAPKDGKANEKIIRASIMTEDDSTDDEWMPPPPPAKSMLPKAKSNKELFNPCIQSPVKKKVEAFEQHAHAAASPAGIRSRTRSKLKENKDPESATKKNNTPLLKREIAKLLTPNSVNQTNNVTPNIGIQVTKHLASSTSKLAQMQKQTNKPTTVTLSKTQSLSRENIVEDAKWAGHSKLQQLAEEKKRKREQKQQQVALSREAREKERAEKLRKAMQEKEEKLRRKAQDAEMRKQLEEINRNIKQQEQEEKQRDAQKRAEKKQQEQENVELARLERQMLDNMKIQKAKEELQKKKLQNQRLHEEKKAAIKITTKGHVPYDFELLESGDSTDEENNPSGKRPPPPSWSKSLMRKFLIDRHSQLSTKIVDSFFSVQPLTPDLREIFPAIDPRHLRRNSSAYWHTPPRYSQLPKY